MENALCPVGKRQEIIWDHPIGMDGQPRKGSINGLGLRVSLIGHKVFVHDFQFNGKRCRKVLGTTLMFNVASARIAASNRERAILMGDDPDFGHVEEDTPAEMTVREAIDRYWEGHVTALAKGTRASFGLFVAGWHRRVPKTVTRRGQNTKKGHTDFGAMYADRALQTIKPQDVETYLKQYTSLSSHNCALRHVKALFNWAIRMQHVDMRNPCSPLRLRKIIRQRRSYTLEQIGIIASHIFNPVTETAPTPTGLTGIAKRNDALVRGRATSSREQQAEFRNYMGILFLTMARPSDLTFARFEHFDLDALVWHKHNTKGIKLSRATHEWATRSVPIHPRVAEMVRAQRARWPEAGLVFPSHINPDQPRDNFAKGLAHFKSLEGVPESFQLYDLKRIAISLMLTGQGVSREAVSHYVDHRGDITTTMIYDLGLVDPLRPVTDQLGALLGA